MTGLSKKMGGALFGAAMIAWTNVSHAEIEFTGYASFDTKLMFSLTDKAAAEQRWVGIGGVFSGFRVKEFSSEQEILTLERDHDILKLVLREKSPSPPVDMDFKTRDERFSKTLQEMQASAGPQKKSYTTDDYMEVAVRFDRVVISVEATDSEEIITMDVPDALRARVPDGGIEKRLKFVFQTTPRGGKIKRTLIIH